MKRLCIALSLVLLAAAPARAEELVAVMATTNANHAVKSPKYVLSWPTQTNRFHSVVATNLTVTTLSGIDATDIPVVDAGGHFATNTVEAALLQLFEDIGGENLDADNLTSGTIPDARFPATLPAASGANLTALNASNLASGTVPDARFPATLPALSGANLTSLNASNLASGTIPGARFPATLPAVNGSQLTALNASNLGSGTVPDARFPATLPALNGSALTALNASALGSGTVPDARFPATLPALNGSALTALNASALGSGTVPDARFPTVLPALNGSALISLNASALASGTVAPARMGSGTANSTTYLRGDGSWAALAGGTDLDASNLTTGTIPDARFPATLPALNGTALTNLNASALASGTVPDARFPATLPALNGSALTSLNASALASGTVPTARLGSGTADNTTYLRGDGSWQTVASGGGTIDGSTGSTDNAILRADGAGGATLQASDISVEDASTSTENNVQIKVLHSGQTNSSLLLTPKGSGCLLVGPRPDGTATGGSARSSFANDFQRVRNNANQVASGLSSVLLGGERNRSAGNWGTLGGGFGNTIVTQDYIFLGGGLSNTANGYVAALIGGESNTASGSRAVVGGGYASTASGANSAVLGGGVGNTSGSGNTASGTGTVIAGGAYHSATAQYSGVFSGYDNDVTGQYSVAAGGLNVDISSNYSFAAGREVTIDKANSAGFGYGVNSEWSGSLTFANNSAAGERQSAILTATASSTSATPVEMFVDGVSERVVLESGCVYKFDVYVVGAGGVFATQHRLGALAVNASGTSSMKGAFKIDTINDYPPGEPWDAALTVSDATDSLIITVTGLASYPCKWTATIIATKVKL